MNPGSAARVKTEFYPYSKEVLAVLGVFLFLMKLLEDIRLLSGH